LPGTPNVIFVGTEEDGIFAVELDSLSVRKVCELYKSQDLFFPFVSYYAESFLVFISYFSSVRLFMQIWLQI
jgi:hypothetical protein